MIVKNSKARRVGRSRALLLFFFASAGLLHASATEAIKKRRFVLNKPKTRNVGIYKMPQVFYTEDEVLDLKYEIQCLKAQVDQPRKEEKADYFKGEFYKKVLNKTLEKISFSHPSVEIDKIKNAAFAEVKKEFGGGL